MENQTKKKKQKRTHKELENEPADVEATGPFACFLIIESLNSEHPLSKLSPFVIEKVPVSLAALRSLSKTEKWHFACRG